MFKAKDDSNIINMFKYFDSYEKLICLLRKISNFSNWIKTIEIYKEQILKFIKPKNVILKCEDYYLQPEENKLDEILDNIYKIKEFSDNNQYVILQLPFNYYQIILSKCENNLENLGKLKNILKNKNNLPQKIIEELEEKEHHIYERKIKEANLMNIEMFEILRKDPYYQQFKFNNKINLKIIVEHINFEKLKKDEINEFLFLFNELNFKAFLPSNLYDNLIIGLINKIQVFDDFELIFKIIDFSFNNLKIMKFLQEKFMKIFFNQKDNIALIELYTIQYISLISKYNYNDYIIEIINEINKTIEQKAAKNIMIKIINQLNTTQKSLIFNIIKFLNDLKGINVEIILFLLKNNNNLSFLIEKMNSFILNYDDFYKIDSVNLKIFSYMKTSKFFEMNEIKDINYIKETKIIYEQIKKDLDNFNITYNYYECIKKLGNSFKERIIILFDEKKGEELYNKIIFQVNTFLETKKFIKRNYKIFRLFL